MAPPSSGRYRYLLNGEPAPVEEHFAVSGDHIHSVRSAGEVRIEANAERAGNLVQRFDVSFLRAGALQVALHCEQRGGQVLCRREAGANVVETVVGNAERDIVLSPLMRVFVGPVLLHLHGAGGEGEVLVPDLTDPDNAELLLQPKVSTRRVVPLPDEQGDYPQTQCFEYLGDQYAPGTRFYVDEQGMLVAYHWRQAADQHWQVLLAPE